MKKILVTDTSYKHTLAAVRYLSKEGCIVDGLGSSRSLTRWSRHLSNIVFNQDNLNEESLDSLLSLIKKNEYDVILPISGDSVKFFSKHRKDFEKFSNIALPTEESIETCFNKSKTVDLATKLKIKIPKTWNLTNLDDLEKFSSEFKFPLVVKESNELFSRLPEYANNFQDLKKILVKWTDADKKNFPLIQEYIDGPGYGFFALYQNGKCKRYFMHKRLRENPPSGGSSCCAVSVKSDDLMVQGKKILDYLNWHGVAMVEFKRNQIDNNYYLIEINSKFWGSLDLALRCGVNFPYFNSKVAMNERIDFSDEYEVGLKFHWPLDGEIKHLIKKPNSFFQILSDTINPKVKSNIFFTDPLPALHSFYSSMRNFYSYIINGKY